MGPNPLRILLVEDHDDTAEVTAKLLGKCGHVVMVAKCYTAAMEVAKTGFDLLITDIGLPDHSGIELLNELRKQGTVRSIATTAYGMPEEVKRCLEAGFDAHFLKPYDFGKLEEAISDLTMRIARNDDMQDASASQSA